MLAGIAGLLPVFHPVHGAGSLSIDPTFTDLAAPGATVTVNVRVDNMDNFTAWDIAIATNTTALNGISVDATTDTVFPSAVFALSCVNNSGNGCKAGVDGPGVVHSEASFLGSNVPTQPLSGVLFSINFRAGQYIYSNLHFIVFRIINGACEPGCPDVVHDTTDGSYGTLTAPAMDFRTQNTTLSVVQGLNVNATATVTSINDFAGQVKLAYQPDPTAPVSIKVKLNSTVVTLAQNATIGVTIMISTAPNTSASDYTLNVTASGPRVFQYVLIDLSIQPPGDFKVAVNPALVRIPQNSTTSVTVTVSSQTRHDISQEFSGNVTLSVAAKNATATLGKTTLYVAAGRSVSTALTVWVPISFYGFTYLINVTGVWVLNHDVNDTTAQLTITHLPSDLIPTVSPNTLTVTAGHSAYAVLSVTSANYFVGYVYPSSTLSGGTARFNQTTARLDIGETVSISVNITMDASGACGQHCVVLLAVTGELASGVAFARSVAENIVIQSNGHLVVKLPTKILGLPIPVYFGILGGFAAIFVLLVALVYRKSRSDTDEWE